MITSCRNEEEQRGKKNKEKQSGRYTLMHFYCW